jgi:hypothetical protein
MMFDKTARPQREHDVNVARIEAFQRELTALLARDVDDQTFDDLVAHDGKLEELRRKISIAEGVATGSGKRLGDALAIAAAERAKAKNDEMLRAGKACQKRVRAIFDKIASLKPELEWLAEHVEEFERYNRHERGALTFAPDAEVLIRTIPARALPAEYRDEVVWEDGGGRRPLTFRRHESGELIPIEQGFTRKVIKVCQAEERILPARLPERLCDAITLVDVAGAQVWPT